MRRPILSPRRALESLVGPDLSGAVEGLAAVLVASVGNLLAGLTLGAITGTLEALPGLLVLVPAAIGMRGNVFGALGSRLGTTIHTGTFTLSRRADTVVGQNMLAAMSLTFAVSLALAVLAKAVSVVFGVNGIGVTDLVVISVVGGGISSVVVLGITVAVAGGAVRFGWDMDNVAAPLVTAAGDVVTLPCLFLATFLIRIPVLSTVLAAASCLLAVAAAIAALRSRWPVLRRIVAESLPVLVVAGTVDVVAGLTIEKRLDTFLAFPALLILVPPFLEDSGALGSILSSRIASKLHLGVVTPTALPSRAARRDFRLIFLLALPVFLLVGLSSDLVALIFGQASPGALNMVGVAMLGGAVATTTAVLLGYYGSVATYRLGLDPDNYGVPIVTSSMDLVGAFSLILAIVVLGLG